MTTCRTCKHWGCNNTEYKRDPKSPFSRVGEHGHGLCNFMEMGPLDKIAYVQDGSDYSASLYTRAEFACNQYEFAEPQPAVDYSRFFDGNYPIKFGQEETLWYFVGHARVSVGERGGAVVPDRLRSYPGLMLLSASPSSSWADFTKAGVSRERSLRDHQPTNGFLLTYFNTVSQYAVPVLTPPVGTT